MRGWLETLENEHARAARERAHSTDESGSAGHDLPSGFDAAAVSAAMRLASPKYVPREWMLAEAYEAAERGEYAPLRELHELLRRPYDEQPDRADRYYRRRPAGAEQQGGIGFMS